MNHHSGWAWVLLLMACGPAEEFVSRSDSLTQVTGFGSNPGALSLFVHTPPTAGTNPALVVALHGCGQSAAEFEKVGWSALATRRGFVVAYPQTTANAGCFNWWDSAQQRRTGAEVTSLTQMVQHLRTTLNVDPARVFVTGLSAGGAMAAVLLATEPDVFSAGAVVAGVPFACSATQVEGFNCMGAAPTKTAMAWGDKVRAASSTGPAPRVSVWHGTMDGTVNASNGEALAQQFINVNAIDAVADATTKVGSATHEEFTNAQGQVRVERWTVAGLGHGQTVASAQGCGVAAPFILDVGLCASASSADFFGLRDVVTDGGAHADAGVDALLPPAGCSSALGLLPLLAFLFPLRRRRHER